MARKNRRDCRTKETKRKVTNLADRRDSMIRAIRKAGPAAAAADARASDAARSLANEMRDEVTRSLASTRRTYGVAEPPSQPPVEPSAAASASSPKR